MAIPIKTIGVKVSYAIETTAGTKPTTGYKVFPMIKEIPEMNPIPDMRDTTSMDNLEFTTGVQGLKPLDVLSFTAGFSQDLYDMYNAASTGLMAQWSTAKADGKAMYLCIDIPGLEDSCYLSVEPSNLGLPAMSTNSIVDVSLYFAPVGEPIWASDPTYAEAE